MLKKKFPQYSNLQEKLYLNDVLVDKFTLPNAFNEIMQLQGTVFRKIAQRQTLRFSHHGQNYFAKLHYGIGWREIFKDLLQGRLPIIGACTEWQAIQHLQKLNIPTMTAMGFGQRGLNPATLQSFLITKEITNAISLEDLSMHWAINPPPFSLKKMLIEKVAKLTKALHESGLNHRDLYIGHFLWIENDKELYIIDLHRAQIRSRIPHRWLVKDLGGLYYSTFKIGLSKSDYLRFIRHYRNQPLRQIFAKEKSFWQQVEQRGIKLSKNVRS